MSSDKLVDDWEQAADENESNLAESTSRLKISAKASEFRPQATASQFVPGQQYVPQQYYPGYPQQMYSQSPYPQYPQAQYGYDPSQAGYSGGYGSQYYQPPQVRAKDQSVPVASK